MSDELLFVYGTLRRESKEPAYHLLARGAVYTGPARYQGKMYRVDFYPGVVPSEDPADIVRGEIYRLRNPGQLLLALDDYEGCAEGYPPPPLFVRKIQTVHTDHGAIDAWIYLYNLSVDGLPVIESGDF